MRTPKDRVCVGEFYNDFVPCIAGLKEINPLKLKEYPQWSDPLKMLYSPTVAVKLKDKPAKGVKDPNPWIDLENYLRLDLLWPQVQIVAEFHYGDDTLPVFAHTVSEARNFGVINATAVDLILTQHPKAKCFEHPAGVAFLENSQIVGFTAFYNNAPELTDYMKERMQEVLI